MRWASPIARTGHELRTTGAYAITRHPIYTGMIAMLNGGGVWLGVLVGGAGILLLKIRIEDGMSNPVWSRLSRQISRKKVQQARIAQPLWLMHPSASLMMLLGIGYFTVWSWHLAAIFMAIALYVLTALRSYAVVQSDSGPGLEDTLATTSLSRAEIHLGYAGALLARTGVDAFGVAFVLLVITGFNLATGGAAGLFIVTSSLFVAAISLWASLNARSPKGPRLGITLLMASIAVVLPMWGLNLSLTGYLGSMGARSTSWPIVLYAWLLLPALLAAVLFPGATWKGPSRPPRRAGTWHSLPAWQRNVLVAFAWRRRQPLRDMLNAVLLGLLAVTPISFFVVYLWCFTRGIKVRDTLGGFFKQCQLDSAPLDRAEITRGYLLLTALPLAPALAVFAAMWVAGFAFLPSISLALDLVAFAVGVVHPLHTYDLMAAIDPQ